MSQLLKRTLKGAHSCFYASGADGVSDIQVLVLFLDHHMINIDPGLLLQVINHIVIMF